MSNYYVPNTGLNARDTVGKKIDLHPCLHEADILAGDRQQMCYMSVYIACVCVCVRVCVRACVRACMHAQSCPTLCNPMDCSPPGSSVHGDVPGKNTIVGCHSFLQGIVPTQGSNPCLLCLQHWQVDSLPLHNLESSYSLLLLLLRHFSRVRLCATP